MSAIRDYALYLIYLCKCSINDQIPTEKMPRGIDFDTFFHFCYDHQLVGIAYEALQRTETGFEGTETMELFKNKYKNAVLKDVAQHYYLDNIREAFAENEIDHTPLKGSVLKEIYPVSYFRQSTDIDILIRPDDALKAKNVMEGLGFENEIFDAGDHTDNYRADKFSYVELHKSLIPDVYDDFAPCNRIPERLVSVGNHEYRFSDEDFYVFMVVHIAKHMRYTSVGIRAILDLWVYLGKYTAMDWDFINSELEKCNITKFHANLMKLADYWFNDAEPDAETLIIADYIAKSGWNGSIEQVRAYDLNKFGGVRRSELFIKTKNLFHAAFMGTDILKNRYPFLEKHPYLLPACWVHRGFAVLLTRHKSIDSILGEYDDIDKQQAARIDDLRKSFGL